MQQKIFTPILHEKRASVEDEVSIEVFLLERTQIDIVRDFWHYLESEVKQVGLTSRWEWVETWLKTYSKLIDYWFVVGIKNGLPCGIALVTKETHRPLPFPVQSFHVSTNGEPYKDQVRMIQNSLLAKPEEKEAFAKALVNVISSTCHVEELLFDDYAEEDSSVLVNALQKSGYEVKVTKEPTLFLDLATLRKNKQEAISAFSKNMRRSIRWSLRAYGDLDIEWAEDVEHAHDILDELIILYQEKWKKLGRKGMFSSPHFTAFQHDIIRKMFDTGAVALFRVTSKEFGTLGCLYLFIDNNVAYTYQIGVNDFSHVEADLSNNKRLKVSYVIHALCMQECLNRGIDIYNFATGIYRFKEQMSNGVSHVVTISGYKSVKPKLRDNIMRMYTQMDAKKNSPKLLRIIRALTGKAN